MMKTLITVLFLGCICLSSSSCAQNAFDNKEDENIAQIDDWQFDYTYNKSDRILAKKHIKLEGYLCSLSSTLSTTSFSQIGFAVGGAKDTNNFLQNLEKGYLPKYDSITYEGLFYDYYFDTGAVAGECNTLFCPAFTSAVTPDLYSKKQNYYLSVGLTSGLSQQSFQRKKLNLVVVLDISGSMKQQFDTYFYDKNESGTQRTDELRSKMTIANESIVSMMKHLKGGDRLGVVLFDHNGYQAKPLRLVAHTDMQAIADHILQIKPRGGTNWRDGFTKGVDLFDTLPEESFNMEVYENRIVFLTDAMPNTGELSKDGLFGMVGAAAQRGIHTSFFGVGIDFNPTLVEYVTKTKGANYYSVHSAADFRKRLADEFDYMVTPLVFDLQLRIKSQHYIIEGVYGAPEADRATGDIMQISTLFPSPAEKGQVKGGMVLLKLRRISDTNGPVDLSLSYKDRNGKEHLVHDSVTIDDTKVFDNLGISKAILLSEYVSLIKNWLYDSHEACHDNVVGLSEIVQPMGRDIVNLTKKELTRKLLSWERKSCPLAISEGYEKIFTYFREQFTKEIESIGDPTLNKELKVLDILIGKTAPTGDLEVDDWKTDW